MVQPSDRPLAAIVSLDLYGYSRLTEQDELGTHRALMACMREQLEPIVHDRLGVIVKSTGDGALVRFPNAGAAVDAMHRFQGVVTASEARFPQSRRLIFRIGIHLAPTIDENGDVFGHGVNLAVRLQEIAEPGSIYLSGAVARSLDPHTAPPMARVGRRTLKNIKERVDVYRSGVDRSGTGRSGARITGLMAAVVLAGMMLPTAALEDIDLKSGNAGDMSDASAPDEHAGNSAAIGSPSGEVEARTFPSVTEHGWIRPYHGLVAGPLAAGVRTTMAAPERSLENRHEIAEDAFLQARALYSRHTPETFAKAITELEQALRLKPGYGSAHALLAAVYWGGLQNRWQLGFGMTRAEMLGRANHHLASAREPDPLVSMVTSEMLTASGRHDQAIEKATHAAARTPERAIGHYAKGRALLFAGRADEAEAPIRTAIRLDPHASRYLFGLALAQFGMNRFDDAEHTLARATARNAGDDWPHLLLAATRGHLGHKAGARKAIGRFDELSLVARGWFASQIPYVHRWPFRNHEDHDRLHLGMVLAGIPETER